MTASAPSSTARRLARPAILGAIAALTLAACSGAPAATPTPAPPTATEAPSEVPATSIAPADASPVAALPTPVEPPPVPGDGPAPSAAGSPAASDGVAREASSLIRGTAVCTYNGTSAPLTVTVVRGDEDQAGFRNGTEDLARLQWRCMKSTEANESYLPVMTVALPSGTQLEAVGINYPVPFTQPRLKVNGVKYFLDEGNRTTVTIGGRTVEIVRDTDHNGWIQWEVRIG